MRAWQRFAGILLIFTFSSIATWQLVVYSPGVPWEKWPSLLVLLALTTYFQYRSISFGKRISYNLGMAMVFPALYVYGIGTAMWCSVVASIINNVLGERVWYKAVFNAAQLAISVWAGGHAFLWAGGVVGDFAMPATLAPMVLGSVTYAILNFSSVALIASVWGNQSLLSMIRILTTSGWVSYFVLGYIGTIFAMFVATWGIYGLLLYGALLACLTELLQIGVKMNVEQNLRKQMEEELNIDSKTQVFNFRYLNEWLADFTNEQSAILFIDLDDFKQFNDLYGHDKGDEVLQIVAQVIASSVRGDDKVIRFGGEEFVVVLPNQERAEALAVAERIQARIAEIPEAHCYHPVTVSIGLACSPDDASDKHELLRLADMAMYQAKARGKNQSCYWSAEQMN